MEGFVKMELPEATEFDVYLDIDGAIEEDEDSMSAETEKQHGVSLDIGAGAGHFPWTVEENADESRHGDHIVSPLYEKSQGPETSMVIHSSRGQGSDNEEVDVDTPFDGKLAGQTQVKCEASSSSLLARFLSYTGVRSSGPDVSKNFATAQKKSAVARKSTTQKKTRTPVKALARKSTTLQKRPLRVSDVVSLKSALLQTPSSNSVSKPKVNVAKKSTSKQRTTADFEPRNALQVKFGPKKSPFGVKSKPFSKFAHLNMTPHASKTTLKAVTKKIAQRMPKASVSDPASCATSVSSQKNDDTFYCHERSRLKMKCPECSSMIAQWGLRSHLKTMHGLPMRNCKKCKITFTDLNAFSEHYAFHLQQEEDQYSGFVPSSMKSNVTEMCQEAGLPLQSEHPKKTSVVKKKPSATFTSSFLSSSLHSSEATLVSSKMNSSAQARLTGKHSTSWLKKRRLSAHTPKTSALSRTLLKEALMVPANAKVRDQQVLPPTPAPYTSGKQSAFTSKPSLSRGSIRDEKPRQRRDSTTSVLSGKSAVSVLSNEVKFPAQRKMLSKSRKSPYWYKIRQSSSHDEKFFQMGDRQSSAASLHSEGSNISDSGKLKGVVSTNYRMNQKVACRRGQALVAPNVSSTSDESIATLLFKKHYKKVTVSLVSLETASTPYDCKTCLAAFQEALICPRSFRQHSQHKCYPCSSCPAAFTHSDHLRKHQEKQCGGFDVKHDQAEDFSQDTALRPRTLSSSQSSQPFQDFAQSLPTKSHLQGGLFECHVCKERFQYRSVLLRHFPYHSFQYSCGICKKVFEQKLDLLDHLQIMHEGRMLLRCRYCEKRFEDLCEFDDHIRAHKDGTVVPCTVCHKKFGNSRLMQRHLNIAHGNGDSALICRICGRSFKLVQHLSVHMKLVHARGASRPIVTKFLSCRFCNKVFHRKQGLSSHYRLRHGLSMLAAQSTIKGNRLSIQEPKSLVSSIRSQQKTTAPKMQTEKHIAATTGTVNTAKMECHLCGRRYTRRYKLIVHYKQKHNSEMPGTKLSSLECKICGKKGYRLHGLKVHYRICHKRAMPALMSSSPRVDRLPCLKCGKSFAQRSSLYRHNKIFHCKTVTTTLNAEKKYAALRNLNRPTSASAHPDFSKRSKPWVCPVCKKSFGLRKSMRMHLKAEHPERFEDERVGTRKCSKCCKRFPSKGLLRAHAKMCGVRLSAHNQQTVHSKVGGFRFQNQPTGNKKRGYFPCTMCERTFTWRQNIIRHLHSSHKLSKAEIQYNMTHTGLTQQVVSRSIQHGAYLCQVCKVCFTERRPFKRHQQRRHGGRVDFFQCRYRFCKKTFTQNSSLFHHMKLAHPGMPMYRCEGCISGFNSMDELFNHGCFHINNPNTSMPCTQNDEEENAQAEESSTPHSDQECRYRCMTCGMGFHIAREWTKHMQAHSENSEETAPNHPPALDATDKVRLNIFDVMSTGSIFSCELCKKIFTDEDALVLHACEMLPETHRSTKSSVGKMKDKITVGVKRSKTEPVRCTVCMKLFSPLSIRKHMMNIHSLPMRVCKKCNIVFTDLTRFKRHVEGHAQSEVNIEEVVSITEASMSEAVESASAAEAATASDKSTEESITYFICQTCGGLFADADSLSSHDCSEKDNFEQDTDLLQENTLADMHEAVHDESTDLADVPCETDDLTGINPSANDICVNNLTVGVTEIPQIEQVFQPLQNRSGSDRNAAEDGSGYYVPDNIENVPASTTTVPYPSASEAQYEDGHDNDIPKDIVASEDFNTPLNASTVLPAEIDLLPIDQDITDTAGSEYDPSDTMLIHIESTSPVQTEGMPEVHCASDSVSTGHDQTGRPFITHSESLSVPTMHPEVEADQAEITVINPGQPESNEPNSDRQVEDSCCDQLQVFDECVTEVISGKQTEQQQTTSQSQVEEETSAHEQEEGILNEIKPAVQEDLIGGNDPERIADVF